MQLDRVPLDLRDEDRVLELPGLAKAGDDPSKLPPRDLALGEDLCLGIFFHLAETREKAIREITPYYEEHVKMFAPLGFVPGITPAQIEAASRRGGWGAAGVPSVEHYTKTGSWFAGPPEELVAYLKDLESRFPGLQHVNMSISMGTPKPVMVEQLRWFAKEVMPKFA